jgi:hypothetical protein
MPLLNSQYLILSLAAKISPSRERKKILENAFSGRLHEGKAFQKLFSGFFE